MSPVQIVELEATAVLFVSENDDEAMFFDWIGRLFCVQQAIGHGPAIHISVDVTRDDEDE